MLGEGASSAGSGRTLMRRLSSLQKVDVKAPPLERKKSSASVSVDEVLRMQNKMGSFGGLGMNPVMAFRAAQEALESQARGSEDEGEVEEDESVEDNHDMEITDLREHIGPPARAPGPMLGEGASSAGSGRTLMRRLSSLQKVDVKAPPLERKKSSASVSVDEVLRMQNKMGSFGGLGMNPVMAFRAAQEALESQARGSEDEGEVEEDESVEEEVVVEDSEENDGIGYISNYDTLSTAAAAAATATSALPSESLNLSAHLQAIDLSDPPSSK